MKFSAGPDGFNCLDKELAQGSDDFGNQIFRTEKERRNNAFHLGIGLRIVDLIPILSGFIGSINIFTCGAGNYSMSLT